MRIDSGNSTATVTYLLTEAEVAFLTANTAYYVRANASNLVCVSVTVGVCVYINRGIWHNRFSHLQISKKNLKISYQPHRNLLEPQTGKNLLRNR